MADTKPGKVIVFDQKVDDKKRAAHMKVHELSKNLRDSGVNLYRCVMASIDPIAQKLFGVKEDDSSKAVADVCFTDEDPSKLTDAHCMMRCKQASLSLTRQGYKVLNTKIYRDPNDEDYIIGKILVSIEK